MYACRIYGKVYGLEFTMCIVSCMEAINLHAITTAKNVQNKMKNHKDLLQNT